MNQWQQLPFRPSDRALGVHFHCTCRKCPEDRLVHAALEVVDRLDQEVAESFRQLEVRGS